VKSRALTLLAFALGAVLLGVAAAGKGAEAAGTKIQLVASSSPDRSAPHPLGGSSPLGKVYIFAAGDAIRGVAYALDGKPYRRTAKAPYDLVGRTGAGAALPFSTVGLNDGAHILVARITVRGAVQTVRATFTVHRLFLTANGSDGGPCTRAAPCKTLSHGFDAAKPGQAVELADGFYDCKSIRGDKSDDVTFVAAEGSTPSTTCELAVSASHVAFRGIQLDGLRLGAQANFVTLRQTNITCKDQAPFRLYDGKCSAGLFIQAPASNFTMTGGSVGPTMDNDAAHTPGNSQIGIAYGGGATPSRNLYFDGVRFHDNRIAPGAHSECLMVGGGDGITIRNSRFDHCSIFDIYFTWWNFVSPAYPVARNILLENNWFSEPTPSAYAVRFGDYMTQFENITVRYNSATAPITIGDNPKTNVHFIGNVAPLDSCTPGVEYQFNVWDRARCDPTDRRAPNGFVDASAFDLRLRPDAAAVNHGDPKDFPARDIFGRRRPLGNAPDAGAVESR
jgi:hypothetical protein